MRLLTRKSIAENALLAISIFLLHYALTLNSLAPIDSYNLKGMWIIPENYEIEINDASSPLTRVYNRLLGWDGHWYYHIAANGYQCPNGIPSFNNPHKCNFGFFPFSPAAGKFLSHTGLELTYALPMASQLAWLASLIIISSIYLTEIWPFA